MSVHITCWKCVCYLSMLISFQKTHTRANGTADVRLQVYASWIVMLQCSLKKRYSIKPRIFQNDYVSKEFLQRIHCLQNIRVWQLALSV